jgi:hypothetical protein
MIALRPGKPDWSSFSQSVTALRFTGYGERMCIRMLSFGLPLSPITRSILISMDQRLRIAPEAEIALLARNSGIGHLSAASTVDLGTRRPEALDNQINGRGFRMRPYTGLIQRTRSAACRNGMTLVDLDECGREVLHEYSKFERHGNSNVPRIKATSESVTQVWIGIASVSCQIAHL